MKAIEPGMDTLQTIRRLAADKLDLAEGPLMNATTLLEAGIDSLAAIELVFTIENEFGISLPAEDLDAMRSLRDLAGATDRQLSRKVQSDEP